ncbi:MAG: hypothetical protein ACI9J0_003022, partial [Cryomorphaceae bacterium]
MLKLACSMNIRQLAIAITIWWSPERDRLNPLIATTE